MAWRCSSLCQNTSLQYEVRNAKLPQGLIVLVRQGHLPFPDFISLWHWSGLALVGSYWLMVEGIASSKEWDQGGTLQEIPVGFSCIPCHGQRIGTALLHGIYHAAYPCSFSNLSKLTSEMSDLVPLLYLLAGGILQDHIHVDLE